MKVVFYDAYNLIYRAKHALPPAMRKSEYGITFAFFRSLAALNRKLSPDLAYFVTEGRPAQRLELLPEYKGTRVYENDDNFRKQRKNIIKLTEEFLPLVVANHAGHECDDVIAHLVKKHSIAGDDVTVVSTDTDFLQLANTIEGYKQYNPIRKKYFDLPEHDYVAWKSLVGDSSDNITGFKGIGNKRALAMLEDSSRLNSFLSEDNHLQKFTLNKQLITFIDMTDDEDVITFSKNGARWPELHATFSNMGFKALVGEKGWRGFTNAFSGGKSGEN